MKYKKLIFAIIISSAMLLTGCKDKSIYKEVSCKVIDKEYHAAYTTMTNNGKTITRHHHPAKYYVKVEYADLNLTYTQNNKELYNEVTVGEEVEMCLKITPKSDSSANVKLTPIK